MDPATLAETHNVLLLIGVHGGHTAVRGWGDGRSLPPPISQSLVLQKCPLEKLGLSPPLLGFPCDPRPFACNP